MSGIPDDVRAAAYDALSFVDEDGAVGVIARAILSERRRCAVIARNWQPSSHQDEQYAANSIADKIMAGER